MTLCSIHSLTYTRPDLEIFKDLSSLKLKFALRELERKIDMMGRFLNDADLINMSLSETKGEVPIDKNISYSHLQEIINDFLSKK